MDIREFTLKDNDKIKVDVDDIVRVEVDSNKAKFTKIFVRSKLSDTDVDKFEVKERRLSLFI